MFTRFLLWTVLLAVIVSAAKPVKKKNNLKCVSHAMYHENGCNYCICIKGQLGMCTLKTCSGMPFYTKQKDCTVNTQWKQQCNKCMCVKQYGTLCTYKKC